MNWEALRKRVFKEWYYNNYIRSESLRLFLYSKGGQSNEFLGFYLMKELEESIKWVKKMGAFSVFN